MERKDLQREYDKLKCRRDEIMRGRVVPNARASRIGHEMQRIKEQLDAIDRRDAEQWAIRKAPIDDMLEVIAIPLLADVMNDIVAGVDGSLRRAGCSETVFSTYTRQIQRAALAMVDTLDHADEGLPNLLAVDDTLVDAVRKKLMSFIKQRLNIKKK